MMLPPLNCLVESRDRRFVWDPKFSFQMLSPWKTGFLVEGSFWGKNMWARRVCDVKRAVTLCLNDKLK